MPMNCIKEKEMLLPICGVFCSSFFLPGSLSALRLLHFLHYKITLLKHLVCFVVLMRLKSCVYFMWCYFFFLPKKAAIKTTEFQNSWSLGI